MHSPGVPGFALATSDARRVSTGATRNGSWTVSPRYVAEGHVELQLARYDIESNCLERTLVHMRPEGLDFVSVKDGYASPGELDVMAHVHGMRRVCRYGGWQQEPFTARSRRHVTVYQLLER